MMKRLKSEQPSWIFSPEKWLLQFDSQHI